MFLVEQKVDKISRFGLVLKIHFSVVVKNRLWMMTAKT
jgi:hypothetical protein